MGLAANQARLLMLVSRKSDLELQQQFLSQSRMQLANMISGLFNLNANLEPGSADSDRLQSRIYSIQYQDKQLEMRMNQINSQHQAVSTEMESVRKVISQHIQTSFKLFS